MIGKFLCKLGFHKYVEYTPLMEDYPRMVCRYCQHVKDTPYTLRELWHIHIKELK